MIIWRFRSKGGDADANQRNFGDELNDWLWPRLIANPQKFAAIPGVFYGIGTVLGQSCPTDAPLHVVFGAGLGYSGVPHTDASWKFYFVRGPHTARSLNVGGVKWITDPGILVHRFFSGHPRGDDCGFMPRWDSVTPDLEAACDKAGISLVDPRWPVATVVRAIKGCKLLLTEALHGAVVADVLRVPWISVYASRGHEFKWRDWCASMEMIWNPIDMQTFTLSWARDFAVPQLSAQSVLDTKKREMDEALANLNTDTEIGRFV